jgi:hypothetical protein
MSSRSEYLTHQVLSCQLKIQALWRPDSLPTIFSSFSSVTFFSSAVSVYRYVAGDEAYTSPSLCDELART